MQAADRGSSTPDSGDGRAEHDLARRLSDLARDLEREQDPRSTLDATVRAAVELIPGAEEGSISIITARKRVTCEVASSELPRRVDAVQEEAGEGPCLDAVFEQHTVHVADLATEQRWPGFSRRAAEQGAVSMLSFQLYVEGDNLGALNLYAGRSDAFDDESEYVGQLFAAHAAVAYAGAQRHSGLLAAVASRQVIGQAQGILMERHAVTGTDAFGMLVTASQHSNTKLRDVAEQVVRGGPPARPTR